MQSFATTTISAGLSTYVSSAGELFVRSCASETIRIRPVDLISKLGRETTGNNPFKGISSRRCVEVDRSMGSLDLNFFFGQSRSDQCPGAIQLGRPNSDLWRFHQKYQSQHLHIYGNDRNSAIYNRTPLHIWGFPNSNISMCSAYIYAPRMHFQS